jgi:hypothetical protein
MTPEERQLITGLFDRMRAYSLPAKDGEAEALINDSVGALPDAPYMLVQSVLVQEQALREAGSRIEALEGEVRALQAGARQQAPASGSFLGGLFGGVQAVSEPPRGASVPQVGARATPSVYDGRRPWTPPHGGPAQAAPAVQATPAGGGFLQTAMATAAGVAGGMLVAGAITSLLGGNSAHASTADPGPAAAGPPPEAPAAAGDAAAAEPAGAGGHEAAPQDVAHDDGGWFGDMGGDLGDLDM